MSALDPSIPLPRVTTLAILSFREFCSVVASLVLREVVRPCEAVQPLTVAPGVWAVDVVLFVCRFDVSGDVCLASERAGRLAVLVSAVGVGAVFLFSGVSVRVSVALDEN